MLLGLFSLHCVMLAVHHRSPSSYTAFHPGEACVTRRRRDKPNNTQEAEQRSTQQWTTAGSSAILTRPNQTPSRQLLHILRKHVSRGTGGLASRAQTWDHMHVSFTGTCILCASQLKEYPLLLVMSGRYTGFNDLVAAVHGWFGWCFCVCHGL